MCMFSLLLIGALFCRTRSACGLSRVLDALISPTSSAQPNTQQCGLRRLIPLNNHTWCHSLSLHISATGGDTTCGRQAFMPIVLAQESRRVVASGSFGQGRPSVPPACRQHNGPYPVRVPSLSCPSGKCP